MGLKIHDLSDVTFIIPVRIDSEDRLFNFKTTISYIFSNFDTNVIVLEADETSKLNKIVQNYKNIEYIFEKDDCIFFHRTKYLNRMLKKVKTRVTVNYDVDIILPIDSYLECYKKAANEYDLVYPFSFGRSQYKIHKNNKYLNLFTNSLDLNDIPVTSLEIGDSECGHAQFFRTSSYIEGGMENENFISYGPEDKERLWRFFCLGYKINWNDNYVYHLEHSRSYNSWPSNPFFQSNYIHYLKFLNCINDTNLKTKLSGFQPVYPLSLSDNNVCNKSFLHNYVQLMGSSIK